MKARFVVIALVAVFVSAMPVHGEGCRGIQTTLSNASIINNTGATANDFDVVLMGVLAGDITGMFLTGYPDAAVTPVEGGVKITWTGGTTVDGAGEHFGWSLKDNKQPTFVGYCWTFNGNPLPNPPSRTWQDWVIVGGDVRDRIRNQGSSSIWVQRRVLTLPRKVILDELMPGEALWNAGIGVDTSRVQIGAGLDLIYDFPITSDISYLMMYDVSDSECGSATMTFLNAAQVCPEPSSIIALLCGLTGIGGIALRRRK